MEDTPNQPPPNPLHRWLKIVLWLMPAMFLPVSMIGMAAAASTLHLPAGPVMTTWLFANILFIIGTGWCDYQMQPAERKQSFGIVYGIALYFLCQIFLAPLLICVVFFVVASIFR